MDVEPLAVQRGRPQAPSQHAEPNQRQVHARVESSRVRGISQSAALSGIERRAWFDLNGDGRIENTSAMMGGDGYLIGDGDGDGHLATGRETWYDSAGRPVPPPTSDIAEKPVSPPPATPPAAAERAAVALKAAYMSF